MSKDGKKKKEPVIKVSYYHDIKTYLANFQDDNPQVKSVLNFLDYHDNHYGCCFIQFKPDPALKTPTTATPIHNPHDNRKMTLHWNPEDAFAITKASFTLMKYILMNYDPNSREFEQKADTPQPFTDGMNHARSGYGTLASYIAR